MKSDLHSTLEFINNHYGRGSIVSVEKDHVVIQKQFGKETSKYRVYGKKVRFRGRVLKIKQR